MDREEIMFKTIPFSGLGLRFTALVRVRLGLEIQSELGLGLSLASGLH